MNNVYENSCAIGKHFLRTKYNIMFNDISIRIEICNDNTERILYLRNAHLLKKLLLGPCNI